MLHETTDAPHLFDESTDGERGPSHILIPTKMASGELSAVTLGLQMAAAWGAKATILHVVSDAGFIEPVAESGGSVHWLDAIDSLHHSMSRSPRTRNLPKILETEREKLNDFLQREVSASLRSRVNLHAECSFGDVAAEIVRFAAAESVDLVVLCSGLSRWRLRVMPARVHHMLQQIRKRVIVVRRDMADQHTARSSPIAAGT